MATVAFRPPKPWTLTEKETITSYHSWKSNLLYHLSICNEFAPYLEIEWAAQPTAHRGLQNDGETVAAADRKTAVQKAIILERMLGMIAQYCPPLLKKDVMKSSTSLAWIWKRVRLHFGFVQSEVHFLKMNEIKRQDDERYETLYQRILAHIDDNLLTVASNIQHNGQAVAQDEVMSPTTERLAVFFWLNLIDERLPNYVARIYAHELSTKSLRDIQPQLSQSMDSLLTGLAAQSDIQVHSVNNSNNGNNRRQSSRGRRSHREEEGESFANQSSFRPTTKSPSKSCSVCKAAGRAHDTHDIASCWFLSKFEKLEIAKTLRVSTINSDEEEDFM